MAPYRKRSYEELRRQVRESQRLDQLPSTPTAAERADWAYGNAVMENPDVTHAMAEKAMAEQEQRTLREGIDSAYADERSAWDFLPDDIITRKETV